MRQLFIIFFLTVGLSLDAHQQLVIIEKGDRQGLADATGKELIPPVYDKIGWSKGELLLIGGLIGYQIDGKWGLISVKNKIITSPDFFSLSVLDSSHIKAAIKGKFSNKLFYGLIDTTGDIRISCRYFQIEPLADGYQVFTYDNGKITTGFIGSDYSLEIPVVFDGIRQAGNQLLAALDGSGKWSFYNQGMLVPGILANDFETTEQGIKINLGGRMGMLDHNGVRLIDPDFKVITFNDDWETQDFADWEILNFDLDSSLFAVGDSIGFDNELFIAYLNGHQEIVWDGAELFGDQQVEVKMASEGYLIVQNQRDRKWSVYRTSGKELITWSDSIAFDGMYFFARNDEIWDIFNRFGRKLNMKAFQDIQSSRENLIPTRKNNYWGLVDFQGKPVTGWKFDNIGSSCNEMIAVQYLDGWGAISLFGDWVIPPRYDTLFFNPTYVVARKGDATSLLDRQGRKLMKSGDEITEEEGYLRIRPTDTTYGLMSLDRTMVLSPHFESIGRIGNLYYGFREGKFTVANGDGKKLLTQDDGITFFDNFAEGFYGIQKDGKYGFVDDNGKLRIANRYDGAGRFKENYCAIKLKGGWGFIDTDERLVIQPMYDHVTNFQEGLAIVSFEDKYGIIDKSGDWVIRPRFDNIEREQGKGYILTDPGGKVGVADHQGKFVLTPQYDDIKSVGNGLLVVTWKGKSGIMDVNGFTRIPFDYASIEIRGEYFVMKKLSNN